MGLEGEPGKVTGLLFIYLGVSEGTFRIQRQKRWCIDPSCPNNANMKTDETLDVTQLEVIFLISGKRRSQIYINIWKLFIECRTPLSGRLQLLKEKRVGFYIEETRVTVDITGLLYRYVENMRLEFSMYSRL